MHWLGDWLLPCSSIPLCFGQSWSVLSKKNGSTYPGLPYYTYYMFMHAFTICTLFIFGGITYFFKFSYLENLQKTDSCLACLGWPGLIQSVRRRGSKVSVGRIIWCCLLLLPILCRAASSAALSHIGGFRVGGGVHDSYTFQCGLVGSFTSPGIDTR